MAIDGQYGRLVSPAQWDQAIIRPKYENRLFIPEQFNHQLGGGLPVEPRDNHRLRQRRFTNNDAFTIVRAKR